MDTEVDDKQKGQITESGVKTSSPVTTHGGSKKTLVIVLLLLVVVGAAAAFFFKGGAANKAGEKNADKAVLSVKLSPVSTKAFSRKLLVNGAVWSWDPISVGSEVGGLKVERILVDEGHMVKRGQVLATLSSSILQAQLDKEKARLIGAKAALSKSIQPNRPQDLTALEAAYAQAQAAVAQEEANLARAKANHQDASENAKRYRWLVSQGAVSTQEADSRETQAKVALAEEHNSEEKIKAARFAAQQAHERMSMGKSGGRKEDVDMARAQMLETEANIKQLLWQIEQTVVRAPADGRVVKRMVHLGDIASNTKTMFEIVRDGRLELRAQIPEKDLDLVRPGQAVLMSDDNHEEIQGTVREITPQVDQDSRLGTVRIDITPPKGFNLLPGNFLRGEILVGKAEVPVVPTSCVVYKGNRAIVYVVQDGKAKMAYVETGDRDGQSVEIISGIKIGDSVIDRGGGFLKDGDPVRVVGQ